MTASWADGDVAEGDADHDDAEEREECLKARRMDRSAGREHVYYAL